MIKIKQFTLSTPTDEYCDLSYLGSFSDEKGQFAVEHTNGSRNSYKYFNADNVENMKQAKENYKEMMEYENGYKSFVGVRAEATIYTSQNEANTDWLINTIHSGGLWGIDSEDTETIESEKQNQLEELKTTLKQLGFTDNDFINVPVIYK